MIKKALSIRLWAKIKVAGLNECWPWTAGVNRKGYGVIRNENNKSDYAHRIVYRHTRGPIPQGMHIMHQCDTPKCCNPSHLKLGTNADNQRDKAQKNRAGIKLNKNQVIAIKNDNRTQLSIAIDYGIHQTMVHYIKSGKVWKYTS